MVALLMFCDGIFIALMLAGLTEAGRSGGSRLHP